ncbi:MAG: FAD:protein FMN transferase [Luteolibacter sp.]
MNSPHPIIDARHFTHEAMNTTFGVRIRGMEESTARGIARECFDQIDALEARLSRFREGSDVWRINRMQSGETLFLNEATHQCLMLALEANVQTGGLFDITLGTAIEHRKSSSSDAAPPISGTLSIHPDAPAITCVEAGREIDLGGIGKGFALDQLRAMLEDWGVDDALLNAGASSILAIGTNPWPIDIQGTTQSQRIEICGEALSASGITIQGDHIVHPQGMHAMPEQRCTRVWVKASDAARAEVWSTTLMLIDPEEIASFIGSKTELSSVIVEREGLIEKIR